MIIMGVDLGDVRTGISICDKNEMLAHPVCVITEYNEQRLIEKIVALALEQKAEEIVLGLPLNMNGTKGIRAEKSEEFAKKLKEVTPIPIVLKDERSTSVSAHNFMSMTNTKAKSRKQNIDALAATIILESYLNFRKNNKNE